MEALEELKALLRAFPTGPSATPVPRVDVAQGEIPAHALTAVYPPMVNLIVNGGKDILVEGRTFHYDPSTYFVLSVDLPAVGAVFPAPDGTPYQAISLRLDPEVVAEMVPADDPKDDPLGWGYGVCPTTPELLDAWVRLFRLTAAPADIPALAPLYEREVLYRVLQGPHGSLLRALARPDSPLAQVRRAIEDVRVHYDRSFHVDELASKAAMSPSAFHRHFRRATGMSPVQYQKKFRLLAARRLLLATGQSATETALQVGYESVSQFSREYRRFFGHPPLDDLRARMSH